MTRAFARVFHFHNTEVQVTHIFLVEATTAIDPVKGNLSDKRMHNLVKLTIEEKLNQALPPPPDDAPDAIKQMVTLDQLGTLSCKVLEPEPKADIEGGVVRFIIRRQRVDNISGAQIESFETFDAWMPALVKKLTSGGYGENGCDIATLMGVEVLPRCS